MLKKFILILSVVTVNLLFGNLLQAEISGIQFSAQMVQSDPRGQEVTGMMYVGDNKIRTEMQQSGQQFVHIIDNDKGVSWMLYPAQKSYMEQRAQGQSPIPQVPDAKANPCAGMPEMQCQQLGTEMVNGRQAVKWEMKFSYQGQTFTGLQWLDVERGIPLRQELPNGQRTELRLLGFETLNGRQVEKWEMSSFGQNQQEQRSFQWYDPKLKLAIREEFSDGHRRELRNIREGQQPDHLFMIPAGYEQISLPTMQ